MDDERGVEGVDYHRDGRGHYWPGPDPTRVRAVDGAAKDAQTSHYLRLPKVRQEGDEMPPHIQAIISDYAKAWEDDIMAVGNADQVGGLRDLLSRTHEADKPGVTAMDETDFDTGPLRGRFKAHPDIRGAYGSYPIGGGPRESCHCPVAPGEACPMVASDCYERAHRGLATSPEKAINTHLRLAAPVTYEMLSAGLGAWCGAEETSGDWDGCLTAMYRAMDARRPVPLVSEAEDRIAKLTKERDAAQRNFDTLCRVNDSLRARLAAEQPTDIDYNGPVKDGRTVPDPAHEQFHRSIGDVLVGKIIPAARRQMEDALERAPKDLIAAPDAILRGNKAPVGIVERKT